jgi:protease-4
MKGKFAKLNEILTTVRQWTVNLLTLAFLLYILFLVISIASKMPETVDPEGRVLIIAPQGVIVDQEVLARNIEFPPDFSEQPQIQYRDLVRVIRAAATDERLQAVTIDFGKTGFSGPTMALGIADELAQLREAGKPLIAYGDTFTTASYLMASQADEIYVHPSGAIWFRGLGGYRFYIRDLLENLKLTLHNYSQGDYKSAGERFTRNSMSEEDRRQSSELLLPLWQEFLAKMAAGRSIEPSVLQQFSDEYPLPLLQEAAYTNLGFALEQGLIDGTRNFPEFRAWMMERFGVDEEAERETYPHITAAAYLAQLEEEQSDADEAVAVVFAQGVLLRGEEEPGVAGADDIADLVRRAYEDENTRALVVRVSSPGGGVIASDMIREELITAKNRGLPVVVSMGDVAASGGMWVSAPADRIYAMPTAIVGSIGVALVMPTAEGLFEYVGVGIDGVNTTEYGAWDIRKPTDERLDAIFNRSAAGVYERFIEVVAEGRQLEEDYVRSIASGRVYLGAPAKDLGLVDEFGDLEAAVEAAAAMAELEDYRVNYVTREVPFITRFLRDLMQQAPVRANPVYSGVLQQFAALFEPLQGLSQPRAEVLCAECMVKMD